ncbi:hypothetical protein AMK21_29545 [Streptomyces sp. CB00316]|nr:hypothetical protein AMK21_29545 [Streptomyces sp. CB00316]
MEGYEGDVGVRVGGEGTRLHEHRKPSPVPVHLMGMDQQGDRGERGGQSGSAPRTDDSEQLPSPEAGGMVAVRR